MTKKNEYQINCSTFSNKEDCKTPPKFHFKFSLSANLTKWSNSKIVWVCLTIFRGWRLKDWCIAVDFSIMEKQQKTHNIIHKIISSTIPKSSKQKGKTNSWRFGIRPEQTSSWWDNFLRRSESIWGMERKLRHASRMFEKLCTKLRPYIRKNKGFWDPISVQKQVTPAFHYPVDEVRMWNMANSFGIRKSKMLKIIWHAFLLL